VIENSGCDARNDNIFVFFPLYSGVKGDQQYFILFSRPSKNNRDTNDDFVLQMWQRGEWVIPRAGFRQWNGHVGQAPWDRLG
jgi:hypothetical protein